MPVVLTPLGKAVVGTLKWIIAPICACFIGYVLIGPRIGNRLPSPLKRGQNVSAAPDKNGIPKPPPLSDKAEEFRRIRQNSN